MDKDTLDYLDQKWLGLASKENLEKLRQEMKAQFRLLREDTGKQHQEGKQEVKADLEAIKEGTRVDLDPFALEMKEELNRIRAEFQSLLLQTREEAKAAFRQAGQEMGGLLQSLWKEDWQSLSRAREESPKETDRLKEGMERIDGQIRSLAQGLSALQGRIGDGIREIKEELGSRIKFSSADLDKKIGAMEARIKALEKIVFP
jgi:DNA anti-recombination protein RmuC